MPLKGARLYIKNTTRLLALPDRIEGELRIEAWNRQLLGARVTLPGGGTTTVDLTPVNPDKENVVVDLDYELGSSPALASSPAQHTDRAIGSSGAPFRPDRWAEEAQAELGAFSVKADRGEARAKLQDLRGDAARASLIHAGDKTALETLALDARQAETAVATPTDASLQPDRRSLERHPARSRTRPCHHADGSDCSRGKPCGSSLRASTPLTLMGRADWSRPQAPLAWLRVSRRRRRAFGARVRRRNRPARSAGHDRRNSIPTRRHRHRAQPERPV